ncbi:MAG: phage integrase N-terminal SAM-like domain-containing protein [Thermosynechococcaceae cyanobacterium]
MVERPKKILEQLRDVIRLKHYSYRTEQTYVDWAYRFIVFHDKRHPKDMGSPEIEAFLTHLAVQKKVAASTQNQALSALVFLYRHVLHHDLDGQIDAVRAKPSRYLPLSVNIPMQSANGFGSMCSHQRAFLLCLESFLPAHEITQRRF